VSSVVTGDRRGDAQLDSRERLAEVHSPAGDDFLAPEVVQSLTVAVLADRARELKSLIAEKALQSERARRPDDQVWSALRRAGFFYQFVPRRFGGLEFTPEQYLDVMLPLAEADPSTGWVACFCMHHNWFLAQFPEEAQIEIWGEHPYITAPDVTFPPGTATRVDGGYRLSGRWKWASGVMNSDWIFAKALVDTDRGPQMGHFVFPTSDAEVIDVWHVDGMCATGSNDVRVTDLFVPDHRMTWLASFQSGRGLGAQLHPQSQLYRMPMLPLLCLGAAIPALGAARACVEHLRLHLAEHVTVGTPVVQAERPAAQMRLGRAQVMTSTAELVLRNAAREGYALADVAEPQQTSERIRIRAQIAYAVGLCREAITIACECAGSSLHFLTNPMQRYKRDIEVMSSHIVYDFDQASELHGRALLGLPPNAAIA
jgi:alkylation response protein AidB-like acyl-CoA dehydrogenase